MNTNNNKKKNPEKEKSGSEIKTEEKPYTLKNFFAILIFFIGMGSIIFFTRDNYSAQLHNRQLILAYLIIIFLLASTLFLLQGFILTLPGKEMTKSNEQVAGESEKRKEEFKEDFFLTLVNINFKYIDKYYLQTQIQANKSFLISALSSMIAFAIVIVGISLMYFNKTNSAYIATGAGILSQFISAVFFYLYSRTIIKMGEYHQKLVLTQNISLALKIAEQMQEPEKTKAQTLLIEQLTKNINEYLASSVSHESHTLHSVTQDTKEQK